MALNAVQINSEVGKQSGYARAKLFTVIWGKSGLCWLNRWDCEIRYEKGAWCVFPIVEKTVLTVPVSKHHSLFVALKSVH